MMTLREGLLLVLLGTCLAGLPARAQPVEVGSERWGVEVTLGLSLPPYNARGLTTFFEENGFDDTRDGFFGDVDYPLVDSDNMISWALQATRRFTEQLGVGLTVQRGADAEARGYSGSEGYVRLRQRLWAVAPVVVWRLPSGVTLGAGPSYVRGQIEGTQGFTQERALTPSTVDVERVGAVLTLGVDARLASLRLGGQLRYLFTGKTPVGPFEGEGLGLEAQSVSLDQVMVGLFVALAF